MRTSWPGPALPNGRRQPRGQRGRGRRPADIVCRNPVEARKDAAARERIVAKLEAALAHGPKTVLGNRGFARFVRVQKGAVRLDQAAIERDSRLDGKFVLRTNTALDPADVARA